MNRLSILIFSFTLLFLLSASNPSQAQQNSPDFLITEVLFNAAGQDEREEWIELTYFGNSPLDISDYKLGDSETAGDNEGFYSFPVGTTLQRNQIIIIAQTAEAFQDRYGFPPDFEFRDSLGGTPNMRRLPDLANGEIALSNSGDEVLLYDEQDQLVDGLNYGESTFFFQPAINSNAVDRGQSIIRTPADCDTNTAADWQIASPPTPGNISNEGSCQQSNSSNTSDHPPIGSVQGERDRSNGEGERVTVQGVVTTIHIDNNASGDTFYTLYLQDNGDGNSQTSDAVPVYAGRSRPDAQVGDLVVVTGTITEYYGLTEFEEQNLKIDIIDRNQPLPTAVSLPTSGCSQIDCETLESMRVTIENAIVIGPTFETASGCGFSVAPREANITRLIRHSDDTDISGTVAVLAPNDNRCEELPQLKVGDRISNLSGALTFNFEQFKIIPEDLSALTIEPIPLPALPPPPQLTPGQISIASFNVENLFDTIDHTGDESEPKPTAAQIEFKQTKIAQALSQVAACPTLIGIQEVENAPLLHQLADKLEPLCGFLYEVSHLESYDGRGIDTALLSNPNLATIHNVTLEQTCTDIATNIRGGNCAGGDHPLFSRPPLRVDLTAYGRDLTVYVNHFKSKRGDDPTSTPRRHAQASHVSDLVNSQISAEGEPLIIVLGDLNDYADSETLQRLTRSGQLTNTLRELPPEEQYSFNFGGIAQLIDAMLVSPAAYQALVTTEIYHTNADFPEGWRSNTDQYANYRTSDHDIPLIILQLDGEKPAETIIASPTEAIRSLQLPHTTTRHHLHQPLIRTAAPRR